MFLSKYFRSSQANPAHRRPRPALCVEQLETRAVPAVSLASSLGVGNDSGESLAYDVAVDTFGNRYMTGYFAGTVDFDPTATHPGDADVLTAVGMNDIYLAKYAPDNALVWAIRMGGGASNPGGDQGRAIELDAAGNCYLTGTFRDTADFGPFTLIASPGGREGYVTKLSSTGTVLWANRWGLPNSSNYSGEFGESVDTDAAGNVYVMGTRYIDGTASGGYDFLKFNAAGTLQWAKSITFNDQTIGGDMVTDAAGNLYAVGEFAGTVDFDPNAGTKLVSDGTGAYSGFVLKLTSAGNFGWVSPFVGQSQYVNGAWTYGYSTAQSITQDAAGDLVVGGYYGNKVDFNPGSSTTNLPNVGGGFITKLRSSNGSLVWAKALVKTGTEYSNVSTYGLTTDAAGNIYATGFLYGSADFNTGTGVATRTSAGSSDAFVLKLTSSGNFGWVETFGSTGSDGGYGIAVDASGAVHLAGRFMGTVDFDPDLTDNYFLTTPGTLANAFLVRLLQE